MHIIENITSIEDEIQNNITSSQEEHDRIDSVRKTLLNLKGALNSAIDISNYYIVTGHFEGENPITRIIQADNSENATTLFENSLLNEVNENNDIYIDSVNSLVHLLNEAKNPKKYRIVDENNNVIDELTGLLLSEAEIALTRCLNHDADAYLQDE